MLYQYTPVQKQTKERIWQVPFIQKKQRTSITNFTKAPRERTFSIKTLADGSYILYEYKRKKCVLELPLPKEVDIDKIWQFVRENTI